VIFFGGYVAAGKFFPVESFQMGPYVSADWVSGTMDAYQETGSERTNTVVEQHQFESLLATVGLTGNYSMLTDAGIFTFGGRVAYRRELLEDTSNLRVGLVSSPVTIIEGSRVSSGNPFSVVGVSENDTEGNAVIGLGTGWSNGSGQSVTLDYEANVLGNDETQHMVLLRYSNFF